MIRPGPMRRRQFAARPRLVDRALLGAAPVKGAVTWMDRLQVALTFLLLLSVAITAAGYCSAQHLLREQAAAERMKVVGDEI